MIVFGEISGIQRYVFDVPEAGGGQARRLRARSFLVQALAECAALRVMETMSWRDPEHFPFGNAGKFLLRGDGDRNKLDGLSHELNGELLKRAGGELRISLGVGEGATDVAAYRNAQADLQRSKVSPWKPAGAWDPALLVLDPLDTPCELCRRERAVATERDPDTDEERGVCRTCQSTFALGQKMPGAKRMEFRRGNGGDVAWLGYGGKLCVQPSPGNEHSRTLRAGIPLDEKGKPVWFTELAKRAQGDYLLAVLKADVDNLGVEIETRLKGRAELTEYFEFAKALDTFFAETLQDLIEREKLPIYTVFAGGDDLVMVGPWDAMFRFAERLREEFRTQFPAITLSAGLSIFKPKRPVKAAVEQAETLLKAAKNGKKDQCAAFGRVWNWNEHGRIFATANRLIEWIPNQIQRGWLHTLLELVETRHGIKPDPMATARLAYHVSRNWKNPVARKWADDLIRKFDNATDPDVQFLPAILRYALTATRMPGERE